MCDDVIGVVKCGVDGDEVVLVKLNVVAELCVLCCRGSCSKLWPDLPKYDGRVGVEGLVIWFGVSVNCGVWMV